MRRLPNWARGWSLSVKLPLLVGLAVAALVLITMTPAWLRMGDLVTAGELGTSRALYAAWAQLPEEARPDAFGGATIRRLNPAEAARLAAVDPLYARLIRAFGAAPEPGTSVFTDATGGLRARTAYARAIAGADGAVELVVVERASEGAAALLAVNAIYLFAAGSVGLAVALVAFYLITSRVVLRPVRALREWAEAVRDGNLDERAEVAGSDEFGSLAATCNRMLDGLQAQQRKLAAINASMDVKLNELAEANETLDRAARVKTEFIASMSHELRTPLNSVIGFGELLLDFAESEAKAAAASDNPPPNLERRRRYLQNIVEASRGLLSLIEGLLEVARIEAGRVEIRTERVDLEDAARGAVSMMEPQARRRGSNVSLEPPPRPLAINTDPRKLQQILLNLLSNAVKFSDPAVTGGRPGRVGVRVEALDPDRTGFAARISVIDNGPGIPPEDQRRVFEKFEQLDGGATRAAGGAGLGLAISRELAALLQGEIQLVSAIGEGSMFSLVLPAELDQQLAREQQLEYRFRGLLTRS